MEFRTFRNDTGEGVVDFEPWRVSGPETQGELGSAWYAHVRIHGRRAYEYGCPCGTCGIVFRKLRSAEDHLTDAGAVELLGSLDGVPPDDVLRRLARVLPAGAFRAFVVEARVRAVEPGTRDDYFAHEVVRLFGLEPPHHLEPAGPSTRYWRVGDTHLVPGTSRRIAPYVAMLTAVAMPLHDLAGLDRARIEQWKVRTAAGWRPTAFAVSILDCQAPATERDCPYEEQFLLTHCIVDGHHRLQAAAELGVPARILSFWSEDFSLAKGDEVRAVIERLCAPSGP